MRTEKGIKEKEKKRVQILPNVYVAGKIGEFWLETEKLRKGRLAASIFLETAFSSVGCESPKKPINKAHSQALSLINIYLRATFL